MEYRVKTDMNGVETETPLGQMEAHALILGSLTPSNCNERCQRKTIRGTMFLMIVSNFENRDDIELVKEIQLEDAINH